MHKLPGNFVSVFFVKPWIIIFLFADYADGGYYSEREEEGILESTVGAFERTMNDMAEYIWNSLTEGIQSLRGFIEQPQAASRQVMIII